MRRLFRRIFLRPKRDPEGRMSVIEHLDELRYRLVWIAAVVAVCSVAGWVFFDRIVDLLLGPARPFLKGPLGATLIFTGPLDAFRLRMKVSVYVGIGIGFPVVLFHIWRFIAPGLKSREKRYAIPFILVGTVLFLSGCLFAYVTLPEALKFLIGTPISGKHVQPLLTGKSYLEFILLYLFAFGVAFEFPVVLMFLLLARVLKTSQLKKNRRYVFIGIAVAVALGTPSVDVFSMVALTVVMYALFESCIWIGRALGR